MLAVGFIPRWVGSHPAPSRQRRFMRKARHGMDRVFTGGEAIFILPIGKPPASPGRLSKFDFYGSFPAN